MDATTADELLKPLGTERSAVSGRLDILAKLVLAGSVATAAAFLALVTFLGDPHGGWPRTAVAITARAPAATVASPTPSGREAPKQDAADVEGSSGVRVVRPDGTGAPPGIIIRIPDEPARRAAAEPRLLEKSKYGPLPRVAADGTRPVEVYARAPGELPGGARPVGRVAIVVGGLGISQTATAAAIARLPAPVTLAFAPYGQDLGSFAERARASGHEIMLQVPMEPFDYPDSDPGPHTLLAGAKPAENLDHLQWAMGRLTGYVGLMNYMGAKVTSDDKALMPILREAAQRGLGFLDDGSSSRSLVARGGGDARVGRADLVLDAVPRPEAIDKALARLEALAVSGQLAVASASALPVTLERIGRWAEGLAARGILLVPASAALQAGARQGGPR